MSRLERLDLNGIIDAVEFPQVDTDPVDYYLDLFEKGIFDSEGTYISLSLSSGGFFSGITGDIERSIRMNGLLGERFLKKWMNGQFASDKVLLPHRVGNRFHKDGRSWRQRDYNALWTAGLAGLAEEQARTFFETVGNYNGDLADDSLLPKVLTCVSNGNNIIPGIKRMVTFPGSEHSIGCRNEFRLAEILEIPCFSLVFNRDHGNFVEVMNDPVIKTLIKMTKDTIKPFGIVSGNFGKNEKLVVLV